MTETTLTKTPLAGAPASFVPYTVADGSLHYPALCRGGKDCPYHCAKHPLPKVLALQNVTVDDLTGSFSDISLSCELDGARYHIWLSRNGFTPRGIVYKNPPLGAKPAGDFRTRRLDPSNSKFAGMLQRAMLATMRRDGLIDKAKEHLAAVRDAQRAERRRIAVLNQKRDAAEQLYDALIAFVRAHDENDGSRSVGRSTMLGNIRKARAAIEAASLPAAELPQ